MKYLVLIFFVTFYCKAQTVSDSKTKKEFMVSKIDSIGNFYIIDLINSSKIYRVISRKELKKEKKNVIIKEGNSYLFNIENYPNYSISNNNPILGFNSSVNCFILDEKTKVCKESNINAIYTTKELYGLYYLTESCNNLSNSVINQKDNTPNLTIDKK